MRVLVQQKATRRFLARIDSWTEDVSYARSFLNRSEGARYCREQRLSEAQAVLKYETADGVAGQPHKPGTGCGAILLKPGRKYEDAVKAFQPYDKTKEANEEARKAGAGMIVEGERY